MDFNSTLEYSFLFLVSREMGAESHIIPWNKASFQKILKLLGLLIILLTLESSIKNFPFEPPYRLVIESDTEFLGGVGPDRVRFFPVNFNGITFTVSELHHEWVTKKEPHVMNAVYNAIRPTQSVHKDHQCLFLDVGMNDGFFTIMAAKLGCQVVSFELQEKCIRVARQGLRLSGNELEERVTIVHRPVAESDDLLLTLPYDPNWCSGVFGFANSNCRFCNPQFESTKTFRSVSLQSRFGFESPSKFLTFVKIDVEGFDNEVLKGSIDLFRTKRILNAVVEIVTTAWRHVDQNVTIDNWIIFDILSFGYTIECMTIPAHTFVYSDSRSKLWNFIHHGDCVDYLLQPDKKMPIGLSNKTKVNLQV